MSPGFYRIVEFAIFSGEYGFLSDIANFILKVLSALGEWNIRLVILFSLSLQIFLILYSPSRKRTSSLWLSLVWLAYLLADWAAGYCVGLISKSEAGKSATTDHDFLMAFWSPFLLLHLGGPYTISAFALEDNELWLRHLLALLFQLVTALRVFALTLPWNTLWVPTIFVFVAGTAKYAERIAALSFSSINNFRKSLVRQPDPGPNYAKLMVEYSSREKAGLPVQIMKTPEHRHYLSNEAALPDKKDPESRDKNMIYLKQVQKAHFFFQKFQGLIVDMIYSSADRRESHDYFSRTDAEEAYRVIEIQLDFMYEFFYTKASLARHWPWPWCKYLCFASTSAALVFFTIAEKDGFQVVDVKVTYALLYGALVLDMMAFLMHIFTDYAATLSFRSPTDSYGTSYLRKLQTNVLKCFNEQILAPSHRCFIEKVLAHFLGWLWIPSWLEGPYEGCHQLSTSFWFRRWSGSISAHNLLKYSLDQSGLSVVKAFLYGVVVKKVGAGDIFDQWKYKSRNPFLLELWKRIFILLKDKSDSVKDDLETIQSICSARGEWVLHNADLDREIRKNLKPFMEPNQVAFDESLLLWHIATTLCYNHEGAGGGQEREISKLLSDYMLYLLVMQPNMMSAVAGNGQLRFKDTCAEAQRFFGKRKLGQDRDQGHGEEKLKEACKLLIEVPTDVKPSEVKGDRSKSVLFDACRLAKELNELEGNKKWELISSMWVELLSYAAGHCRPTAHVQLLSKGGELVSFVWLLMVQLGLSTQFQIMEGDARAKLIVGELS